MNTITQSPVRVAAQTLVDEYELQHGYVSAVTVQRLREALRTTAVPKARDAIAMLRAQGVTGPIRADLGAGYCEEVVSKARIRERIAAERTTANEIMSHPPSNERDASAARHYSIADALEEVLDND